MDKEKRVLNVGERKKIEVKKKMRKERKWKSDEEKE